MSFLKHYPYVMYDFCDFSEPSHHFCKFERNFVKCHARKQIAADFRRMFVKYSTEIFGISQVLFDFDESDAEIAILYRVLRKKCHKMLKLLPSS